MTLLEKAKATPLRKYAANPRVPEKELDELTLAWLKDDIRYSQVSGALAKTGSTLYAVLASSAKRLFLQGRIVVKK